MRRIALIATLVAAFASVPSAAVLAADPHPDFSRIDPTWAAQELDSSFQQGEMGSAWAALKTEFPADYRQMTQDMANALIQNREWRSISQAFLQAHVAGQIQAAQRAPAEQQLKYQRKKAEFLKYLSTANLDACAVIASGSGDTSVLEALSGDQMKRYSDLIAVVVETISAGLKAPIAYAGVTPDDVSKIKAVMSSQGVSEADIQNVLSGNTGATPAEKCRIGVIWHSALAAAPADITAKMAFLPN